MKPIKIKNMDIKHNQVVTLSINNLPFEEFLAIQEHGQVILRALKTGEGHPVYTIIIKEDK